MTAVACSDEICALHNKLSLDIHISYSHIILYFRKLNTPPQEHSIWESQGSIKGIKYKGSIKSRN